MDYSKLYRTMRPFLFFVCLALGLGMQSAKAQTEVTDYRPGITEEGITYFLPTTGVRVVITTTRTHYTPGELCSYARRYLPTEHAVQKAYDIWHIDKIEIHTFGIPDSQKAYTIKLNPKSSAPLVALAPDGRLLAVNTQALAETPLPQAETKPLDDSTINASEYKTQEILNAGSLGKMAELVANEIFDTRDKREALTKGEADFMPKDGAQLQIMLKQLERREKALLQLFCGTTQTEQHTVVKDFCPTQEMGKGLLIRFSKYLGFVDADDLGGAPFYVSVKKIGTLPARTDTEAQKKKKKEEEDLRYIVPGKAEIKIYSDDKEWAAGAFPLAQFGYIEHLGGDLFNKRFTTKVQIDGRTGALLRIDAERPQ